MPGDNTTSNKVFDNYGTIGGGGFNHAGSNDADPSTATFATVGGGKTNFASGESSTIGGGKSNTTPAIYTTVGGGFNNNADFDRLPSLGALAMRLTARIPPSAEGFGTLPSEVLVPLAAGNIFPPSLLQSIPTLFHYQRWKLRDRQAV